MQKKFCFLPRRDRGCSSKINLKDINLVFDFDDFQETPVVQEESKEDNYGALDLFGDEPTSA